MVGGSFISEPTIVTDSQGGVYLFYKATDKNYQYNILRKYKAPNSNSFGSATTLFSSSNSHINSLTADIDGTGSNTETKPKDIDCSKALTSYSYLSGFNSSDTLINIANNDTKIESLVNQVITKYGGNEFSLPNTYTPLIRQCTWMEHWSTGDCYIHSYKAGRKVSSYTDQSCNDVSTGRSKMIKAIRDGYCCVQPVATVIKDSCTDSDNGKDYFTKGGRKRICKQWGKYISL